MRMLVLRVVGFGLFGLFVHGVIINRRFLDSEGRKSNHRKKTDTVTGASSTTESVETLNDATPLVDSVEKEVVSLSVVDETMAKEKQSPLVTTSAGNAPGKSSYANVTGKPSGKKVNTCTLFTLGHPDENLLKEDISNVPVWVKFYSVLFTTFNEDGLSAIATKLGTPLMLDSYTSDMCMQSWGRSSNARVMIELQANVELKDNIVMAMPKITREGHYIFNVRVKYEWKPSRKFKELFTSGQAILVDEASNPLKKVEFLFEYDSEDEVVSVDNNMARSMASEKVGHDLTQELQAICDNLVIRVRDPKKK
nr:hypothetical protein [Tanacetum cinerariifolium]